MSEQKTIPGEVWRTVKLVLFQLCVLFWLIKLAYATRAYFLQGMAGVRSVILHGNPIPTDPTAWGHPQWGWVALRYGVIAVLTIAVGFVSRPELKEWWVNIRHGRAMK
jgi:hypothetical protein